MSNTAARLLRLLSFLQVPYERSATELAERLDVSQRTIRRDIERLRDLGYLVRSTMGPEGGYCLVSGQAMPPLLLDEEEALAIAVSLRTAAIQPVSGIDEASVRALAKLEQVLPSRLRRRIGALNAATVPLPTGFSGPSVDPEVLIVVAMAIANRERVRFDYQASDQAESKRLVEPHRLVSSGRRWYLLAYDIQRDDWRTFRIDRMRGPRATGAPIARRELPAADAAAYIASKMADIAPVYQAVATVHASAEDVTDRIGPAAEEVVPVGEDRSRLRTRADSVEWLALRLVMLGCAFEVHEPPQLAEYLRELASRAAHAAG
jgi:predicted DNA-binding transcriptional regulator YafY